jgi:hypothetical protein
VAVPPTAKAISTKLGVAQVAGTVEGVQARGGNVGGVTDVV